MSNYGGPTYSEIKAEDDAREALAATRLAYERAVSLAAGNQYFGDSEEMNIAAGGCVPYPYIGDVPPFTPYGPGPVYPGGPLPNSGTTSTSTNTAKKEKTMDVYLIWAITADAPDAPWVVSAWDSEARADNEDGFQEDLSNQEENYGARFIRVTVSSVNYDAVVSAFEPVKV